MIIVSQSKRMILNFDNILGLGISSLEDKSIAIKMYESNDRVGTTIARYGTEERAKEVLQEIVYVYEHMKYLQTFQNRLMEFEEKPNFVYEMPED